MIAVEPTEPPAPLGEALELMRRLWRVSHEFERLSSRMASTLGVTAQQRATLRLIGRFPALTAGRLSSLLCVDAATVSITLGRLEKRGLVARTRDRDDARRVTVALTTRGRRLDAPAQGTVEAAVGRVLRSVSARDVGTASRVLDALAGELALEGAPASPKPAARKSMTKGRKR